MLKKQHLKTVALAAVAGFLLWLGLSPRSASWAYEEVLMPRVRADVRLLAKETAGHITPVPFSCTTGHSLQGMLYHHPTADKIILFFAGRSSNLAKCVVPAQEMRRLGVSVFVFEYAGFGNSPGRPSTNSVMEDGLAAYAAVINLGHSPKDIILYGESLGAAVAAYVSARRLAAGLVLQSGFSSLEQLAKEITPLFRVYPSYMFSKLRLASDVMLKNGHPPLLIIHGDQDDVIGKQHAVRLAAAAGKRTTLALLKGAGHFHVHEREDWRQAMRSFLVSVSLEPSRCL